VLLPFLLRPPPGCSSATPRHRTAHASLITEILALLAGARPAPAIAEQEPLREPLSESETRVLRYLPTKLSKREIANELSVSLATVKTHSDHIYTKLGVHSRGEAVERARALGLLAPSARR
jgi:LuxR family transcriptional regulator, maltose regulon positive regulatory protein